MNLKQKISITICLSLLFLVLPLAGVQTAGAEKQAVAEETTNRVIVKMRDSKALDTLYHLGYSLIKKQGNLLVVQKPGHTTMKNYLKEIRKSPFIQYAEPDYKIQHNGMPNDPAFSKQWHHKTVKTEEAWNKTKGSEQIIVAVIDNGFDLKHPDLAGRIVKPYDAVNNTSQKLPVRDHGTHVAGIIAANADNQLGGSGIAPHTSLMPINVFTNGDAYTSDIIKGIQYAVQSGADIINMSLGMYSNSQALNEAIQSAYKQGVVIVAAAGNDNSRSMFYPASYQNVISVGATTQYNVRAYYSNYGSAIDITAPGSGILSTVSNGQFMEMSGTSMATPIVSGAAALLLANEPYLTNEQVAYRLTSTAVDVGAKGRDDYYGAGILNVGKALSYRMIAAPTVNALTDKDKQIILKYPSGFTGIIRVDGNTSIIKKVAYDEPFELEIPISAQKGDSIISVKLIDSEGNESWPVRKKVKDTTPPAKPIVNKIKDSSKAVSGTAESGVGIVVKRDNTVVGRGTVATNGTFAIQLSALQKAGTKLSVQAVDKSGNESALNYKIVLDKTAPRLISIKKFTIHSTSIIGRTEPNATVMIHISNKQVASKKSLSNGAFSIPLKKQKVNTNIKISLKDQAGNISSPYQLKVVNK